MALDLQTMTWLNPPPRHDLDGKSLRVTTGNSTDFWQQTYYGFCHDNGHFLHVERTGDFTAEAAFTGRYETLYDQAGLMVRLDDGNWMKCGIEFTDGVSHFSTVVTVDGRSDWSAFALPGASGPLAVRATRLADALFVQYRLGTAETWKMARLAYFPQQHSRLLVGVTACSPQREGFEVEFHHFAVGDPVSRDIH